MLKGNDSLAKRKKATQNNQGEPVFSMMASMIMIIITSFKLVKYGGLDTEWTAYSGKVHLARLWKRLT